MISGWLFFQFEAPLCVLGAEVQKTHPQASCQSPPQVKVHEVIKQLVSYSLYLVSLKKLLSRTAGAVKLLGKKRKSHSLSQK